MNATFRLRTLTILSVLILGNRLPLDAQEFDFAQAATVPEQELSEERAGFTFGGMTISFGAEVRTYLNDELALQTNISWNGKDYETHQIVLGALTEASAEQLRAGVLSSGQMTISVGEASVFLANEGQTALIHRTEGGIQNVLVNTASNVSARQELEATLELDSYETFRADALNARILSQVEGVIHSALSGGLGR